MVDITSIGQEELKEVIKNELKEVDLTDYEEQKRLVSEKIKSK
ncbi:MAG: hypothetical protein ACJA1N_002074 [Saprospiraceae bacterium]